MERQERQGMGSQARKRKLDACSEKRWYDDGGLRRRFELTDTNHVMEGVFHLDGVFEGAARYRSCERER